MEEGVVIGLSCAGGVTLLIILLAFAGYKYLRNRTTGIGQRRQLSITVTSDIDAQVQGSVESGNLEMITPNSSSSYQVHNLGENNSTALSSVTHSPLFPEANRILSEIISDYVFPIQKSVPSSESLSSFDVEVEENIYENVEPRNSLRQTNATSPTPTSTGTLTQGTSYSAVLFSVQNHTESEMNHDQLPQSIILKSTRKKHRVDQRLSPPISRANTGNRRQVKNLNLSHPHLLTHSPRYNFPYKTLVIATDATPKQIGGYLINHFSKRVEFYSVPSSGMPWILRNRTRSGNPTEFEMKNLLIALLLWEDSIVRHTKLAIFTDNSAIIGNSLYGSRVRSFIQHLENCRQVLHVNPNWTYVNSKESPDIFNEFIIPADHLSRLNEPGFRSSIVAYHFEFQEGEISHLKFNAIRHKILKWTRNPCSRCGFHIPKSGSLKRYLH